MPDELTNLLPAERRRAISRDYIMRLGVIAVWCVTALTFAAGMLLVPTYVFLSQNADDKKEHLSAIDATLSSSDGAAFSARLATLTNRVAVLSALADAPSASGVLRTALSVPRPGVSLTGFVYAPASGKKPGTLTMSGVAATRDALRKYQIALSSNPFSTTADLPVSTYAKESNIPFTIVVTLAP